MKLKEKIMDYEMYKDIEIKLPPKREKKVVDKEAVKAKRELEKKKNKISKQVYALYTKYLRRKGKDDKKVILSDLEEEWGDIEEENGEFLEDNEDFHKELDSLILKLRKKIKTDVIKSLKENLQDMRIDDK